MKKLVRIGKIIILAVAFIVVAFPFFWCLMLSFKSNAEIMSIPTTFFPSEWIVSGYKKVLTEAPFMTWLWNSLFSSVVSTAIVVFLMLLIPLVIKELAMLCGALLIMRTQKTVEPSHWYGKAATVIIFLCSMIRILVRGNGTLDPVLAVIMLCVMVFALIMYYFKDFKGKYKLSFRRQ